MVGPRSDRLDALRGSRTVGVGAVRRLTVVAALASVLGVVACGSASDEPEPTPTDAGGVPSDGRTMSPPTSSSPTRTPAGTEIRLSGVVRTSPEDRLVMLEARAGSGQPARTWVLVGPVRSLADGERVTVLGRPDPGADTTAQRGPVFRVESVERS